MRQSATYDKDTYIEHQHQKRKELENLKEQFCKSLTLEEILPGIIKQKHQYSFHNSFMLYVLMEIRKKKECREYVGIFNSFINWQRDGYCVLKGEKGFPVVVPTPKMIEVENKRETGEIEKQKKKILYFKIGTTFDISQTTAFEDYKIEKEKEESVIYNRTEISYEDAYSFVLNIDGIKIVEEPADTYKRGYITPDMLIHICNHSGNTLLHETGHLIAMKTGIDKFDDAHSPRNHSEHRDYSKGEVLAEIGCFLLSKKINPECVYNFNYSNVWSSRIVDAFTLDEFGKAYMAIKTFIDAIK